MKIIIIDDEKNARETIKDIITISGLPFQILAEADSVKSGVETLQNVNPDILLLDINLPDGNGFDILTKVSNTDFKLIFITAYDQYAIKAIKFSAFDYILKPVDPDELINTLREASTSIEEDNISVKLDAFLSNMKSETKKQNKLILKTAESINIVNIDQIIRCESDGGYTTFYMDDKRSIMVSKTLKEFDELLGDCDFFRSHQSHIVNINYIKSYEKRDGGYLLMSDDSIVPVSTRKKDKLLSIIKNMYR